MSARERSLRSHTMYGEHMAGEERSGYVVEFGEGWHRIENGWYAVLDQSEEPPSDEVVIPDGYKPLGMIEK